MKRNVSVTPNRADLMRAINRLMRNRSDLMDDFESILLKYGADRNDDDPQEGFFHTMSNTDLSLALSKMRGQVFRKDLEESGISVTLDEALEQIKDLEDSAVEDDYSYEMMFECYKAIRKAQQAIDGILHSK